MRKFLLILAASAALFAANGYAEAPRVKGQPAAPNEKAVADKRLRHASYSDADTVQLRFTPMDEGRISKVRARNSRKDAKRLQIAISRDTRLEAEGGAQEFNLNWQALPDGGKVARFAVTSPGAPALRLGLNIGNIPAGAELRFIGAAGGDTAEAMARGDEIIQLRRDLPVYWTPVTEGETQIVEIYLPAGADANSLRFSLDSVSHFIVSPFGKLDGAKAASDTCEVDVKCVAQTTAFVNTKNSVARMVFHTVEGDFLCTGTLLNDSDTTTKIPYFFSASHCISTQPEASSLTTLWGYENTACRSGVAGSTSQVAGGATLLFNDTATDTDAVLLRLNNAPPSGAFYSGWDAATIGPDTSFTVVHHPAGDVKKVSLGRVLGFADATSTGGGGLSHTTNPNGHSIEVGYVGPSTEGGSSGAGLLTTDASGEYFLRGGLLGGPVFVCNASMNDPNNRDYYSRFDLVYLRISQFLAPGTAQFDYTGAWSNASESGWGLSVVRGSSGAYGIIMYHYNQSTSPTWYFMSGGSFNGTTYTAPVFVFFGPWYGTSPFNTAAVGFNSVGTASINFTSATEATMSYTISGATVSNKSITKLNF